MREFSSERPAQEEPQDPPLASVSFALDGVEFRCLGEGNFWQMSELARQASQGDMAAQLGLGAQSMLEALGPEEYARFQAHIRKHGTPDEVIGEVMAYINEEGMALAEAEAGRPTRRRSSSSAGPQGRERQMSRRISLQTGSVTVLDTDGPPERPAPQDHLGKQGKSRTGRQGRASAATG